MKRKPRIERKELLTKLYEQYEQKMYVAAYAILHSVEQAEDTVQDSFLKLVPYLPAIDSPGSVKTKRLIMRIVRTTAIDQYRKNQGDNDRMTKASEYLELESDKVTPIQSAEDRTMIKELLQALPDDYLEVIRLHCYYGFTCRETAEILSLSEANIWKRLERARKQILKKMEESTYEQDGCRANTEESWEGCRRKTI